MLSTWYGLWRFFKICKNLLRRTASDKVLLDKAFDIAKNPKYDGDQQALTLMVYTFFDKKTSNINKETGINSDVLSENN